MVTSLRVVVNRRNKNRQPGHRGQKEHVHLARVTFLDTLADAVHLAVNHRDGALAIKVNNNDPALHKSPYGLLVSFRTTLVL